MIKFDTQSLKIIEKLKSRYPEGKQKSALLPVLHMAQAEFGGWLSAETMEYVASLLDLQPIEVFEVASFYSMFNLKPVGKCVLEICRTGPCWLNGAEEIVEHLEKKLNIKAGETTADGMFTLKTVECLAACGNAPVMQVGLDYHENLSIEKVDELLENFSKEQKSSAQNPYI
ncbi:MAG: NAD(P)H-dependent oxidoreductase subunit E [Bacteroidota bacterium]